MASLQKILHPPVRQLRQFAGILCFLLVGWGAWLAAKGASPLVYTSLGVAGAIAGLAGWLWPAGIRPLFVGLMILVAPLEWVFSYLFLGIIYFAVVTPIGIIGRLAGRDPLGLRSETRTSSYWKPRKEAEDLRRYFRQF